MVEEVNFDQICSKFEGQVIGFNCIIMGVESIKSYIVEASITCPTCNKTDYIKCDEFREIEISRCWNRKCRGTRMKIDRNNMETSDIQYVLLQEPTEDAKNNSPRSVYAILTGSNVGLAYIGQRKHVVGKFVTVVNERKNGENEFEHVIDIETIEDLDEVEPLMPTDEMVESWRSDHTIIDRLVSSYAPHILGYHNIKMSLILALIQGTDNENIRGWINILLVGDPGVAKTELLRWSSSVVEKLIYTTGRGSTGAGLTAGVVKLPNGTSILQAGVYPLSHNGFAAVDEFDKMGKEDRSVLHYTMEHGRVSRSVAGFPHIDLAARVGTLAAANPKFGKYIENDTLMDNINIPQPLLTRFDMVWLIRDTVDSVMDTKKAEHIISTFRNRSKTLDEYGNVMEPEEMKMYINYARSINVSFGTNMSDNKLINFYNKLRNANKSDSDSVIPINPRHLQSMVRLAMAHAKLRLSNIVEDVDIDRVIELYDSMMESFGQKLEDDGFVQVDLSGTKKINEEKQWTECYQMVADEKGYVNPEELYDSLNNEYGWSEKQFNKYYKKLEPYLLLHGGKVEWIRK